MNVGLLGISWSNLERPKGLFGSLEAILGRLGSILGCIGNILGQIGLSRGMLDVFEALWDRRRPSWAISAVLEAILNRMGTVLGPNCGPLRPFSDYTGSLWGSYEAVGSPKRRAF